MKLLIAGYGSVGQYVTDFVLKDHRIDPNDLNEIHIISRKTYEEVKPRIEISKIAAGISERFIPIYYHSCDFNNIDGTAEVLQKIKPDIVVYSGRFAPGVKYGSYSYSKGIGYGVWAPLSIVYIHKLMEAVNRSKIKNCKVINTSFPDLVNNVLFNNGYDIYCGAGNLNHLVPRIKYSASNVLKVKPEYLEVYLAGTHYLNTYVSKEGNPKGCPFYLRIADRSTGKDLVNYNGNLEGYLFEDGEKVKEIISGCKDNSASGHIRNQMIATDCAELIRILVTKDSEIFHVPGFKGRVGGEFVRFFEGQAYVSDDQFERINKEGLKLDGVFSINKGIGFTQKVIDLMKESYGIDYPSWIHLRDLEEFANTIVNKMGWSDK